MVSIFRQALAVGIGSIALCASFAALANVDNRFNQRDGGIVGGEGDFSEGQITVFHNFIDADRQALNQRIADLQSLIASLESDIAAKEQQARDLKANYNATRNRMTSLRNQWGL